jgi:hypothetical protein
MVSHQHCDTIVKINVLKEPETCERFLSLIQRQKEDFRPHYFIIENLDCEQDEEKVLYIAYNSKTYDICGVFVITLKLKGGYLYINSVITKSKRTSASNNSSSNIYRGIGSILMEAIKSDYEDNPNIYGFVLGSVPTAREFYKKQGFILLENGDDLEKYPDNAFDIYRKDIHGHLDNPDNTDEEASRTMVYLTKSFKDNPTPKLEQLFLHLCMTTGSKRCINYLLKKRGIKIDTEFLMNVYVDEDNGYIWEWSFPVYYFYKELNIGQEIFNKLINERKGRISKDLLYAYLSIGLTISNFDLLSIVINEFNISDIIPVLDLVKEQIIGDEDFNITLFKAIKVKDFEVAMKYLQKYIDKDLYSYIKKELIMDTNTNQKLIQYINKENKKIK